MGNISFGFDKEQIEALQRLAAVSGASISQISESLESVCNSLSESMKIIEDAFKDIKEVAVDPPDDIATLKKQIKHCKNPMETKMLNKRLNDAYKKNKRRKNERKHFT